MVRSEGFEVICQQCNGVAGRVRVVIDSRGVGKNTPERPIPPRCPECNGTLFRRPI